MLKRKVIISASVILLCIAGMILFYVFDPETHLFFTQCPFLTATGYKCPGCGSQRAIHHFLHFDIAGAFRYNSMMIVLLPYILIGIYLEYFDGKRKHPELSAFLFGRWAALMLLVGVIAFWIGRNC